MNVAIISKGRGKKMTYFRSRIILEAGLEEKTKETWNVYYGLGDHSQQQKLP